MQTSNFANWQRQRFPGAISISRHPAHRNGWDGPEFPPLMPSSQLLKAYKDGVIDWEQYKSEYLPQLGLLRCQDTWNILHEIAGPHEPVLLCYESAKTLEASPCHRRLVAEWFERNLSASVPEWSKAHV